MDSDVIWTALALVLVFEGLMPFIAPGAWKRMFMRLMELRDGQLRFFGLCCMLAGLILLWALS